ncbi:hypothetical protein E5Q_00086 [Mixia osmundae IAM 14324]|uniref:Phosphotransferase n=1 Tax=Mixia osmundae (strain CBS 9802 / IAM 14324 / JCM 22182 / KY 12970) TaxID=764103 RepID=G7DS85_MIXOS|nr:hypothetical protein E5Q_00086 [Mixia osmundae IAM 14324]
MSANKATPSGSPDYLIPLQGAELLDAKAAALLAELERQFDLPKHELQKITDHFGWEYRQGLAHDSGAKSTEPAQYLPMIPTFVSAVPDGSETGTFLALDLGGTNLRVCEIVLKGDGQFTNRQQKYKVSEELKTGTAVKLFDYIADSVDHFLNEMDTQASADEKLYLGFTFSFPVIQTALNKGTLLNWTKGFTASGAAGNDVVGLLQSSLDKKHIHVHCSALVNDTVGTLLSRAYQSGDAFVGAIFGTGTNGAYVESMKSIPKLKEDSTAASQDMIVNTEWGAFDNARKVLRVTPYDNKVDRESINPRRQCFEKMISGMYLGEVTRNVILHLIDHLSLFDGHATPQISTHYGLDSALMSAIEAPNASFADIRKVVERDLGVPPEHIKDSDLVLIRRASELVGTRGARLSACALAATILQTHRQAASAGKIHIGVDGSLAEFYPRFEERMRRALVELLGDDVEQRIVIGLAKDGSGVGAALTALVAKKQRDAETAQI